MTVTPLSISSISAVSILPTRCRASFRRPRDFMQFQPGSTCATGAAVEFRRGDHLPGRLPRRCLHSIHRCRRFRFRCRWRRRKPITACCTIGRFSCHRVAFRFRITGRVILQMPRSYTLVGARHRHSGSRECHDTRSFLAEFSAISPELIDYD